MQPTSNTNPETIQNPVTLPVLPPMPNTGGSHKMIIGIVAVLVLIILAAGGGYWYLNNRQAMKPIEATPQPIVTPSATPVTQDSLEKDLNAIDAEASASGLDSVDADLKGL